MAVNRIILRDGKKVCVPILKKSEYYRLRDVDFNRQCAEKARKGEMLTSRNGEQKSYKTLLEQFNYSLTTPSCPSGIPTHTPMLSTSDFPRDGEEGLV